MKSFTVRAWSFLALEAHEARQVYFTQHLSSAGSCLISIWLGAMPPTAPHWPCGLEASASGKGSPTLRASPRPLFLAHSENFFSETILCAETNLHAYP